MTDEQQDRLHVEEEAALQKEANWLPAPDGPFALALRIHWPGQETLDGKWEPSAIEKA